MGMVTFRQFIFETADIETYRANHPKLQAATKRLEDARSKGMTRWGDTRRFSGKMAGNRLANADKAHAAWSKTFDAVTREYNQKHGTKHR